jgi:hypothetical protein
MGLWNSIKKAAKGVGKFVKKNWKTILGVAAAVAIPFAAPAIGGLLAGSAFLASVAPGVASFLGGSLGAGVIGAGLGAGAAALTGQNPLLGAALGGVGGFAGAAGGLGGMFGGGGGLSGVPAGASAVVPATGGIIDIGGATVNAATGMAAGGAGITGTIGSLATKLATNPQSLGALASLATTMFNKDITELTPEEEAQLKEVAAQAATNRALFETQVMEARKLIQAGTPNPEQAYANARMQTEAQLGENRRSMPAGLQEADERKGAIESTKAGLQNVAVDYAQAAQTRRAGVQSMPDGAPTGYAQLAMPTYNSLYERRNDYDEQISKGVGALFGSLA